MELVAHSGRKLENVRLKWRVPRPKQRLTVIFNRLSTWGGFLHRGYSRLKASLEAHWPEAYAKADAQRTTFVER